MIRAARTPVEFSRWSIRGAPLVVVKLVHALGARFNVGVLRPGVSAVSAVAKNAAFHSVRITQNVTLIAVRLCARPPDGDNSSSRVFPHPGIGSEGGGVEVHGIVWAGVRTERFDEATAFFRDIMGLPLHQLRADFAWFRLPDSSEFEIFGPADDDHSHFSTGPVPSFHVDDVHAAVEELQAKGIETFGPWGEPRHGWAHFRAADGNIYGLSAGEEYHRRH